MEAAASWANKLHRIQPGMVFKITLRPTAVDDGVYFRQMIAAGGLQAVGDTLTTLNCMRSGLLTDLDEERQLYVRIGLLFDVQLFVQRLAGAVEDMVDVTASYGAGQPWVPPARAAGQVPRRIIREAARIFPSDVINAEADQELLLVFNQDYVQGCQVLKRWYRRGDIVLSRQDALRLAKAIKQRSAAAPSSLVFAIRVSKQFVDRQLSGKFLADILPYLSRLQSANPPA